MTAIVYRDALESDAEALIALRRRLYAETSFLLWEAGEFNKTSDDERALIQRIGVASNSRFLLAESSEGLVGWLLALGSERKRLRHSATIGLAVARSHWRQGIAGHLLGMMTDWADAAGVQRLELTTHTSNLAALNLYLRCGFQVEGVRRASLLLNDIFVDEYLMARLLPQAAKY